MSKVKRNTPKKDLAFWESARRNDWTYIQYYNRLMELAISRFKWINLPKEIDERFLELVLFSQGKALFFYDDVLGYLTLKCTVSGGFDVYRIPINRRAYADNHFQATRDINNSVIIYNNLIRTNSMLDTEMFAERLYNLDRAIDVNANAQKTPVAILCTEEQQLTMLNLYQKWDGNQPFIMGYKDVVDPNSIKALSTGAPYVADKLYTLKTEIWNEALTYLGINNTNTMKRERLISDEVIRNSSGVVASRQSALEARRKACKQINEMFGLDIWVDFRNDIELVDEEDVIEKDDSEEVEVIDNE